MRNLKKTIKYVICFILVLALAAGVVPQAVQAATKKEEVTCKSLFSAALKKTGGSKKLKYASTSAMDFGAFSHSDRDKVESIQYAYDKKEVYSLCVVKAKDTDKAKSLLKTLKSYKANNNKSDYLSDYTSSEKKVFKNAICGRKGVYVWYIAMSTKKATNQKGQSAIKNEL